MTHVVMFLTNAFRPDPRVAREAQALVEAGYQVTIICWDRQDELASRENYKGIEIIRIKQIHSVYGSGWRQLFYLPRFWRYAIKSALELQPDIVHCHDLDTLYIGQQLKEQIQCPLVYDAHEHYPAVMSLYLPRIFVKGLIFWESYLMRSVDATITASTLLRDEFLKAGICPVISLGNYPDLHPYTSVSDETVRLLRKNLGLSEEQLMVAYVGGFSRDRMLLPFIQSADLLPDVEFHIWGKGLQLAEVEKAVKSRVNAHYHGWLPADSLPAYFKTADIIYYCLRLDYPGAIYNAPNTLAQAMAAGKPIVANEVGDLGRIVRDSECGILIQETTPGAIATALEKLKEPVIRQQLGANGLRASQESYNNQVIQAQLVDLYNSL